MSIKAMSWVWQQPIKGSTKLVLLALADNANDDGKCWPGIETVVNKCGIARNTVIGSIRKLKKQGLIVSERRYTEDGRRTSNLYKLSLSTESVRTDSIRTKNVRTKKEGLSPEFAPELKFGSQFTGSKKTRIKIDTNSK